MGASEQERWAKTKAVLALARFATTARRPLALAAVLALMAAFAELVPLYVVYRAADELIGGTAGSAELVRFAVIAAAGTLAGLALFMLSTAVAHVAAFEVLYGLRVRMTDRLARLPLGYFDRRRSGDLKKVIVDDVERLELFIAHGIPEMSAGLGAWLATTAWLFAVDWRMGAAAAVLVPVAFWMMHLAMRRAERTMPAAQAAERRMNGSVVEYVGGMPAIKVFNRSEDAFVETRAAVVERTRRWVLWSRAFITLGSPFYSLVVANVVTIVPVGLLLYESGRLSLATLLFFIVLGIGYSVPLLKFFEQGFDLTHLASSGELVELILTEPPLPDSERRAELRDHSIEFRDVSFAYSDRNVLTGVSFAARQGEVTALVGPSGAGKTTIARLIGRFWDVTGGAVLLGGVDVREIAVAQLVDEVAFVFQDTFLFDDTIETNIKVARPGATPAEVRAATRAARCAEFIAALPDGYATQVGERGSRLSGGERQRIAIARAILKDSPVIVLDEATAFADPDCEADIQDAISALVAGRTLVVVAHRLSTVTGADRIVVLDHGRVVEGGTHSELLARDGLYEAMWRDHIDARRLGVRALPSSEAPSA